MNFSKLRPFLDTRDPLQSTGWRGPTKRPQPPSYRVEKGWQRRSNPPRSRRASPAGSRAPWQGGTTSKPQPHGPSPSLRAALAERGGCVYTALPGELRLRAGNRAGRRCLGQGRLWGEPRGSGEKMVWEGLGGSWREGARGMMVWGDFWGSCCKRLPEVACPDTRGLGARSLFLRTATPGTGGSSAPGRPPRPPPGPAGPMGTSCDAQAGGRPAGQPFCVPSRAGPEGAGELRQASPALIQHVREEQPWGTAAPRPVPPPRAGRSEPGRPREEARSGRSARRRLSVSRSRQGGGPGSVAKWRRTARWALTPPRSLPSPSPRCLSRRLPAHRLPLSPHSPSRRCSRSRISPPPPSGSGTCCCGTGERGCAAPAGAPGGSEGWQAPPGPFVSFPARPPFWRLREQFFQVFSYSVALFCC